MRGRAFGFVAIICVTWVAARIGFTLFSNDSRHVSGDKSVSAIARPPLPFMHKAVAPTFSAVKKVPLSSRRRSKFRYAEPHGGHSTSAQIEAQPDNDYVPFEATASVLAEPKKTVRSPRPVQIYAYSFWRRGDAAQGVLGNGQYGGSQSALVVRVPLLRFRNNRNPSRLALIGRAAMSHDDPREREFAAGLQWRPSASLPAQFALERRFRPDREDAFAGFVSGGHDKAALPLGFALDAYGQAGFVTGKDGGGFADVQMHALKPVIALRRASLAAGAGTWGGGQSHIMRLDIGPSLRADLQSGSAQFRLDASWRFRIAGNAQPGSGPAVTLSTSF